MGAEEEYREGFLEEVVKVLANIGSADASLKRKLNLCRLHSFVQRNERLLSGRRGNGADLSPWIGRKVTTAE